jgi:hypothetical protein
MPTPLTADDGWKILGVLAGEFPAAEQRANREIRFHAGTTDEFPGEIELRAWPVEVSDRVQAALTRAGHPNRVLPAEDGVRVIVGPKPDDLVLSTSDDVRAAADELTRTVGLAASDFRRKHGPDLDRCTPAARDGLLVRFVVTYLLSAGLATATPTERRSEWTKLELDEPYASAMEAALAEAVEQRARFDAAARQMTTGES